MLNIIPYPSAFGTDYTLSRIRIHKNKLKIPKDILEDCILLHEEYPNTADSWDEIRKLRVQGMNDKDVSEAYSNLPFIPSVIIRNEQCMTIPRMKQYIKTHPFVKSCYYSPKDLGNCIFTSAEEAYNALVNSNRVKLSLQDEFIIMKIARNIIHEMRCFWLNDSLKVVISTSPKESIEKHVLDFFRKHRYDLPHTCCIELCISHQGGLEVIEINACGPDCICDITPLDWYQNWETIYTNSNPLFVSV